MAIANDFNFRPGKSGYYILFRGRTLSPQTVAGMLERFFSDCPHERVRTVYRDDAMQWYQSCKDCGHSWPADTPEPDERKKAAI